MTENTENTLSAYLGTDFQQRLIWQLLVEPEFAEKALPNLAVEYFDDPNIKRLFIIIMEYFNEFDKVPNLQNQSIHQAISKYKTPNNDIEEESLLGVIKRITLWNERIINKQMLYDGDVIQKSANAFIKQQEYRKVAEDIMGKVKSGQIKDKKTINVIEDRFQKISHIGEDNDDSESILEGVTKALRKEFRETIPTGIVAIDDLTGGGLGKGEIGVVLTPSGVGKTTFLTKIADTAYLLEKNVAQIIFEDTKDQIKRKHYTIWANSALSKLNDEDENVRVTKIVQDKVKELEGKGRLIVKRFSQEDTTMKDIRNWMLSYEKKWGFKFDLLVLDYLDCLESHKRADDRNESELTIIKGFEALSSDFDIPAWTAIQSNRSGFGSEFVEAHQSGGSIKRIQKAHFFMSIAKTQAQQEANFANIRIIKARFAKDGQAFEDCVFNNDTLEIKIDDPRYRNSKNYAGLKHFDDASELDKTMERLNKSSDAQIHAAISQHGEKPAIEKVNSSDINSMLDDNAAPEQSPEIKPNTEFQPEIKPQIDFDTSLKTKAQLDEEYSNIDNVHISTTRTGLSQEALGAILGIANEAVSDERKMEMPPDDVVETTVTTINEMVENPIHTTYIPMTVTDPTVSEPPKEVNFDDIESQLLDPDEIEKKNDDMNIMLVKKRDYQSVIQKE